MSSILLIEDELSLANPLVFLLRRDGYEVRLATDGASGLKIFFEYGADLILLDLMLPGMNGFEVCAKIREKSQVPLIMLTAKDSESDKVHGLDEGADDYVTKPYSMKELTARIRSVLRRKNREGGLLEISQILRAGSLCMDCAEHTVYMGNSKVILPFKEFALLECLLRNMGRVVTRSQLIEKVWGSNYFGDTKTLDVHIKRLRSKIEANPAMPEVILTVRGVGYKIV